MAQAVITSGFVGGSTSVVVAASVADATVILLYDDNAVVLLGSGTITAGLATITLANPLFAGQRIIAYITTFGDGAYKGVTVTDGTTEKTGWKLPATVDGVPYADYLTAGGVALPSTYDPDACRNYAKDNDFTSALLALPITFTLRQIESQAGTVQVLIENIANAIGGHLIKFDSDAAGTTANKLYSANGTYQVKVWGGNQVEADAVVISYTLTMPSAVTVFGTDIYDMGLKINNLNDNSTPGERPVELLVLCSASVVPQFQIDGEVAWTTGTVAQSNGVVKQYSLGGITLALGIYTIRARRQSDGLDEISREVKIVF